MKIAALVAAALIVAAMVATSFIDDLQTRRIMWWALVIEVLLAGALLRFMTVSRR